MHKKKPLWGKPQPTNRPTATITKIRDGKCFITCPYCSQEHAHLILETGQLEARAAACDLWYPIDPKTRLNGYQFTPHKDHQLSE